jgi:hypothetical protein
VGFNTLNDLIEFVPPRIDFIGAIAPPVAPAPLRADRPYFFPFSPVAVGDIYLMLPYYGRRYAHLNVVNSNDGAAPNLTYELSGINFSQGLTVADNATTVGLTKASTTVIGSVAVAPTETKNIIADAADGVFDFLQVKISGAGLADRNTTLRVLVSDRKA